MIRYIFVVFMVTLSLLCSASESMYDLANKEYNEGKYEQALESYKAVLSNRELSPEVYYNMGNCYYRLDRITEAIYHYERALKLDPSDEDAKHNLKLAYAKTIDKIEPMPQWGFIEGYKNLSLSQSADYWAMLFNIFLIVGFASVIGYLFMTKLILKRSFFFGGIAFVVIALVFLVLAVSNQQILSNAHHAIIFSPSVSVKSAPGTTAKTLFVLHEGAKVHVDNEKENWVEIELPNGNKGWIKSSDVKKI